MDSRIRDAHAEIEKALSDVIRYSDDKDLTLGAELGLQALSILTAEPEPCEDAREVATQCAYLMTQYFIEGYSHSSGSGTPPVRTMAEIVESYASRLTQEARADELRRFEPVMGKLDDALGAEDWNEVKSAWCDLDAIINPDRAAILQGTEPAKVSEDVETERAEEVAELHAALRMTISRLSDLACEDPPSKRLKAQALSFADRLVARLKEGAK